VQGGGSLREQPVQEPDLEVGSVCRVGRAGQGAGAVYKLAECDQGERAEDVHRSVLGAGASGDASATGTPAGPVVTGRTRRGKGRGRETPVDSGPPGGGQ